MYSPEEIDELVERLKEANKQVDLIFAFFNNHWCGYAPRNAVDMKGALTLSVKEPTIQTKLPEVEETR